MDIRFSVTCAWSLGCCQTNEQKYRVFIQVPFPITGLHAPCPALLDLACELSAKAMPPVPNGFMAHIDTAFMQKVFYISQWEWKPHIQHNCKLDDLRATFEIAEGCKIGHGPDANIQHDVIQGGLFWQNHPPPARNINIDTSATMCQFLFTLGFCRVPLECKTISHFFQV